MNAHILLVEGTCGMGKSTLLRGLLTKYVLGAEKPRTLLHLTQAHTYFPLVSGDPVSKRQHREHLRRILRMLDWDAQGLLYGLLDTLHLTHSFRPGTLSWSEMGYVDQNLARLGGQMVFIRARPETLWERIIILGHYPQKSGRSAEEVHEYYVREQAEMEKLARRSSLPTLFLEAEDSREDLLSKAYVFWMKEKG